MLSETRRETMTNVITNKKAAMDILFVNDLPENAVHWDVVDSLVKDGLVRKMGDYQYGVGYMLQGTAKLDKLVAGQTYHRSMSYDKETYK